MGKILQGAALLGDYARLALGLPGAAKPEPKAPKNILFLGYAAVGDLIFLLPALKALRHGLPEARIVFVGDHDTGATELMPATHLADEIWTYTHPALATESVRDEIVSRVWDQNFDAVIVGQATPLRPFARAILPIPVRVAHLRPIEAPNKSWSAPGYAFWKLKRGVISSEFERRMTINRPVWVKKDADHTEHVAALNLRLIAALGLPVPAAAEARPELPLSDAARNWARAHLPDFRGRTVGIHLGSPQSQYHKIWHPRRWGAVATELVRDFRCRVALFGGPEESGQVDAFKSDFAGSFVDLVGKAKLLETFAAIGRCDLFLSSDTGLSKAAMALRVPTLTVWGPSDRPGYGALWDRELHSELYLDLPCSPCVRMGLRKEGAGVINFSDCGHHNCLEQLTPNMAYAAIQKYHGTRLRG